MLCPSVAYFFFLKNKKKRNIIFLLAWQMAAFNSTVISKNQQVQFVKYFPAGTWRKRILWKILFWAVERQGKFHPA